MSQVYFGVRNERVPCDCAQTRLTLGSIVTLILCLTGCTPEWSFVTRTTALVSLELGFRCFLVSLRDENKLPI